MACRGGIPLEYISVDFEIGVGPSTGDGHVDVQKTLTLKGTFTEEERLRLSRTAAYCSVGQFFSKRSITIEDQVEIAATTSHAGVTESPTSDGYTSPQVGASLVLTPGSVRGRYLWDTQEWDVVSGKRTLAQEGEVKVYMESLGLPRPRRWSLIGGHTSGAWGPLPIDLATAGLAASTVGTLRDLVPPTTWSPSDLEVLIEVPQGRARYTAQEAAVAGAVREQRWDRKVVAGGPLAGVSPQAIHQALESDPIYRYFRSGDLLSGDEIRFT